MTQQRETVKVERFIRLLEHRDAAVQTLESSPDPAEHHGRQGHHQQDLHQNAPAGPEPGLVR